MTTLFINASPNRDGNTATLAHELIGGVPYTKLNLVDYTVYTYGQGDRADDQFAEVVAAIRDADDIVIGSPMYWHSMSGMLCNVLDRSYGVISEGSLAGRRLWFVFQGAAPTRQQLDAAEFTMSRYAGLHGMRYMGMVLDRRGLKKVSHDFRV